MPELTQDLTPGSAVSSTPPGGKTPTPTSPPITPPATATAPVTPTPYRFGNDSTVDEWARGKSPEEVLAVTRTLMQSVGKSFQQAPPPAPTPAPAPSAAAFHLDPEGYVTGAQAQRMQTDAIASIAPQYNQAVGLAASGNLNSVRRDYAKDFSRFGPEIYAEINNLPQQLWTVDNLEKIVKYVKVGHLDELAREQAEQLVHNMEPSMRSIGGAGAVPTPADDNSFTAQWQRLPPEWRAKAERDGITESVVREFVAGNEGMTVQDFFKTFGNTAIGEGATR